MIRTEININPDIITWAITRAGYSLSDFIPHFPKVQGWLENKKKPTMKQLEEFSKKVHLPFGYLFLSGPPEESLPIPFFRTNNSQNLSVSINVYDTILLLQQRQDWLKEYLIDNEFEPLHFVGKFKKSLDVSAIVNDIRNTLDVPVDWARAYRTWEEALNHLGQKIEDKGIVVVFNGVVENNTKRPIKVEECRGFVLVDNMAPFMFVNNADSKSAQMFTLVHELAHIWIGQSAGFDFRKLLPADNPAELLCDKVAAEFLVPEISFNEVWSKEQSFQSAAKYFKVSEIVIARRALDTGKITLAQFFEFYDAYLKQEHFKKEKQEQGGDFYATAKKRLGLTYAAHVYNAVKANKLLYRDAYKLTGLKGDTFQTFFTKHF